MLDHTHAVEVDTLEDIDDADGKVVGKKGRTTHQPVALATRSRSDADGNGMALSTNEHEHAITSTERGGETDVRSVSGPQGLLRARVPDYGKLRFLDRKGVERGPRASASAASGRIAASSKAARRRPPIWTFSGINESVLRTDDERQRSICRWS